MLSSNMLLLNLTLLIDVTFSTPTGVNTQISIPFDSVQYLTSPQHTKLPDDPGCAGIEADPPLIKSLFCPESHPPRSVYISTSHTHIPPKRLTGFVFGPNMAHKR